MYNFSESSVRLALDTAFAPDAIIRLCHPFGKIKGPAAFYSTAYAPLFQAIPDLERRDTILVSGETAEGATWIGACGYYTGSFQASFLDIPPTGHQVSLRYHEFFQIEEGKITEIQAIWDIPSLIMQANAWPMSPSLGREWLVPGPATQDGMNIQSDEADTTKSMAIVIDMLTNLSKHPTGGGPEIMQLEKFWHPRMSWYGPSGIGTCRGIEGFRNWHQIPFLNALPDRRGGTSGTQVSHFFAEGNYVAVTGWPNMEMTVTGDGWLGIAPSAQKITMKSLDFWRVEGDLIRENWVLVDLLDVYRQLGVDVLARLREFNKARFFSGNAMNTIGD